MRIGACYLTRILLGNWSSTIRTGEVDQKTQKSQSHMSANRRIVAMTNCRNDMYNPIALHGFGQLSVAFGKCFATDTLQNGKHCFSHESGHSHTEASTYTHTLASSEITHVRFANVRRSNGARCVGGGDWSVGQRAAEFPCARSTAGDNT